MQAVGAMSLGPGAQRSYDHVKSQASDAFGIARTACFDSYLARR